MKKDRSEKFVWFFVALGLLICMTSVVYGGTTERVSVSSTGEQGNYMSGSSSISDDGRYVAFSSQAWNLVPGHANTYTGDIFVHDRQTGMTEIVSVSSTGQQGNRNSGSPSISADGRYVAFSSDSTNLVNGDTNGYSDVFVHDRVTGVTGRVSLSSSGVQGNNGSYRPSLSADGRFVAFYSYANNLVAGDTNGKYDVFVHDRLTGVTERVSVSGAGVQGNGDSKYSSMSANGQYVAFESLATNLVADDTNAATDIFVHDRLTGSTERVSISGTGLQGNGSSYASAISAGGQQVVFLSYATNFVPGDTNGYFDVFVHDRLTGGTDRVNVSSAGQQANNSGNPMYSVPATSADGRYVVFDSFATNLIDGDANAYIADIFIHDRQTGVTEVMSVSGAGEQGNGNSYSAAITADGQQVAFSSWASNLVLGDTAGWYDVFVHTR
jgi:hypothetical protein